MASMPFTPCSQTPCEDVTVNILTTVFGPVVEKLTTGTDPAGTDAALNVIATMMSYFNSGVLTVATLIVSFVTVMGVINTANDGEAFGRNWSTLWTPVRIVGGAAVLLPTGTGYSFIQLMVLMFSLWGIGFANGTYRLGIENGITNGTLQNVSKQIGMTENAAPSAAGVAKKANTEYPLYNLRDFAGQYLENAYCAKTINDIYAEGAVTGTNVPNVRRYSTADKTTQERDVKTIHTMEWKDRNTDGALGGGEPICGTASVYSYKATTLQQANDTDLVARSLSQDARQRNADLIAALRDNVLAAKMAALSQLASDLDNWVNTWPKDINNNWDSVNVSEFNRIVERAQNSVATSLSNSINGEGHDKLKELMTSFTNDIRLDGWAMAGGYYQRLSGIREEMRKIYSESPGEVTPPALRWLPNDAKGDLARQSAIMPSVVVQRAIDNSAKTPETVSDPGSISSFIPRDWDDASVAKTWKKFNAYMGTIVGHTLENVTNSAIGADGNADAIGRIKATGDQLTVAYTTLNFIKTTTQLATKTAEGAAGATAGVPILSGANRVVQVLAAAVTEMVVGPIASTLRWLEALAFYFGVFLPSLPYTIFIIAVVGWLLSVLQTAFAAPLWAVLHMTPDRTFIGSQTQGYLMILSLFMRPALIIVALFAAMLIANPVIMYVSKAFWLMRTANVNSTESLGWMVQFMNWKNWLIVYGFLLLPIVYMIFGLTQALPDAVLTWVGAGIKPLGETQATGEMRAGMERYGPVGAGVAGRALGGDRGNRALTSQNPPASGGNPGTGKSSDTQLVNAADGTGYAGRPADHVPRPTAPPATTKSESTLGGRPIATAAAAGAGAALLAGGHTPGPTGAPGPSGPTGPEGEDGKDGRDGRDELLHNKENPTHRGYADHAPRAPGTGRATGTADADAYAANTRPISSDPPVMPRPNHDLDKAS